MTLPIQVADPPLPARWEVPAPVGRGGAPFGMCVSPGSEAATWVTGRVFHVEGGWRL